MEGFFGSPRSGGDFCVPGRLSGDQLVDWWGVCGAPVLLVLPQLRLAGPAGGQIHATCDIGGEEPMAHRPNTPFDDLEPAAVLTAAEVAERIRVDARSVRRAVARGDLTASRACGLRILAYDAAEWWRSRTVPATPLPAAESAPVNGPPERSRRGAARRRPEPPARLPLPPRRGDGP